jgi:predicted DNA-binding protein (MmcQ/YjbR family)
MSRDLVNAFCATLPGAEVSDPWGGGHDAWKIGGKMFACIGAMRDGLNVKTDSVETAEMLIAAGVAERARYFHRSWVYLPEDTAAEELRHRILRSYDIIRAALPKRLRAALAPRAGDQPPIPEKD